MELLWWILVSESTAASFRRLKLINLFACCLFSTSRRALGHKDSPTQLHAYPPFIEITPALMNSNLLPRVSAPEPWQGIIHLVRSLARFYSFQATISLKCLISKFPGQFGRGSKFSKMLIGFFAPGQNFQKNLLYFIVCVMPPSCVWQ